MMIKMNGKLYSGTCSTEANKTNHKRFEDDILEITDKPCYQSADQGKNKFVHHNFYDSHRIFHNNPCNSTRTDEDFVICWDPEDENDDDNNSSDQVPPLTKKAEMVWQELTCNIIVLNCEIKQFSFPSPTLCYIPYYRRDMVKSDHKISTHCLPKLIIDYFLAQNTKI